MTAPTPDTSPGDEIDEIINASPIDKEVPKDVWKTIYPTWTGLWTDAYGEWDECQPSDIYPLTELLSTEAESRLKDRLNRLMLTRVKTELRQMMASKTYNTAPDEEPWTYNFDDDQRRLIGERIASIDAQLNKEEK